MSKKIFGAVAGLAVLGLAGAVVNSLFFGPSDEQLIQETLLEATEAARKGEASPVLDSLSRNFEYGDMVPVKMDVAKVIREARPEMILLEPSTKIDGERALVETDIQLTVEFMGMPISQTVPDVAIELKKETSFSGVLPKPKWRVTKVTAENLPQSY